MINCRLFFSILVVSLIFFVNPAFCYAESKKVVIAELGVEIFEDDKFVRWAKSHDELSASNQFRIHIVPRQDCYLYLVFNEDDNFSLKYSNKSKGGQEVILPASSSFYGVDSGQKKQRVTIVCSPEKNEEIEGIFGVFGAETDWKIKEKEIIKSSKISFEEATDKPVNIGGSINGFAPASAPKVRMFPYRGKSLLVKKYEFSVKK